MAATSSIELNEHCSRLASEALKRSGVEPFTICWRCQTVRSNLAAAGKCLGPASLRRWSLAVCDPLRHLCVSQCCRAARAARMQLCHSCRCRDLVVSGVQFTNTVGQSRCLGYLSYVAFPSFLFFSPQEWFAWTALTVLLLPWLFCTGTFRSSS